MCIYGWMDGWMTPPGSHGNFKITNIEVCVASGGGDQALHIIKEMSVKISEEK